MSRKKRRKRLSSGKKTPKRRKAAFNKLPFDTDSNLRKAVQYHQSGQLEKAERIYKKILKVYPDQPDCLHLLGFLYHQVGRNEIAEDLINKAIRNHSQNPHYYTHLGNVLQDQGQLDKAIWSYQKAIELKPDLITPHYDMGVAFQDQGKLDEAIACYHTVVQLKPDLAGAHSNMGVALQDKGQLDEAIACFRKAIRLRPDHAEAYNNMGKALKDKGQLDEAILNFQKAVHLQPDLAEAYNNLGAAFSDQARSDQAMSYFQKALRLRPDYSQAYENMAKMLQDQGKRDEALSSYQKALELGLNPGIQVKMSLLLPVICESKESIERDRKRLIEQIESLKSQGLTLVDPPKQVGMTNFYLAFHGLNDKEILKKIASFYLHACPDLGWIPANYGKRERMQTKIKIGMLSRFLYNHTIGELYYGLIKNLSREKFHVVVFRFPGREKDRLSRLIDSAADEVVILPYELRTAREHIAAHSLDIIFYLEIGMDPLTYFLAFSRLAPVQCKRGYGITSGIPNVDYFISSENSEPPEAEHHYSEQLVLLKNSGLYYYRPPLPKEPLTRQRLGLPEHYRLYVCPQSLFKFHPDSDNVLGAILRQDPRGLLVLIEGTHGHWTKLLHDRFVRAFPDTVDRVRFLPRMPPEDFLSLCMLADVVLDTPHFSGGKTSLDCFAFGIPIVTWPGQLMRGRLTLAYYKQMGVMDCVASDAESYVNIALRLANDKTWRNEIKEKILSHADVLYEDIEAVRELESFFEWAIKEKSKKTVEPHYFS